MEIRKNSAQPSHAEPSWHEKVVLRKINMRRKDRHIYRVKTKKATQQRMMDAMERARLAEYAMYMEKPWRLLGMNFLIGLARGLGTTIGLALVLALLVFIAQEIISANLPGISKWLADLLGLVQSYSVSGLPYND